MYRYPQIIITSRYLNALAGNLQWYCVTVFTNLYFPDLLLACFFRSNLISSISTTSFICFSGTPQSLANNVSSSLPVSVPSRASNYEDCKYENWTVRVRELILLAKKLKYLPEDSSRSFVVPAQLRYKYYTTLCRPYMLQLTCLRFVLTLKPSMIAFPEVIGNSPVNIPNVVVLPAPK